MELFFVGTVRETVADCPDVRVLFEKIVMSKNLERYLLIIIDLLICPRPLFDAKYAIFFKDLDKSNSGSQYNFDLINSMRQKLIFLN